MSNAPLRVGVISANWGMSAHLPAWRANRGVEVVGVCTAHRPTAEAAARAHEIPMAFWDYREMVSHPDIDLVDIGTRPNLRYEMCMEALEAGKHVYHGIPFADTLEHAVDLRDAAESAPNVTAIDAYSEYLPPIVMAKEIIDDNGIGELYSVNCVLHLPLFNAPRSDFAYNWFWDRTNGCSALRNLGSHALNVVYRLFGQFEEVIAQDTQFVKEWQFTDAAAGLHPQIEDTACVLFRLRGGGIGTLCTSWVAVGGTGFSLDAFGSKGHLLLQGPGLPSNMTELRYSRDQSMSAGLELVEIPDRLKQREGIALTGEVSDPLPHFAMALVFEDMLRAVRTGTEARPNFAQAYHVHSVIEAAHQSATERSWVRL